MFDSPVLAPLGEFGSELGATIRSYTDRLSMLQEPVTKARGDCLGVQFR